MNRYHIALNKKIPLTRKIINRSAIIYNIIKKKIFNLKLFKFYCSRTGRQHPNRTNDNSDLNNLIARSGYNLLQSVASSQNSLGTPQSRGFGLTGAEGVMGYTGIEGSVRGDTGIGYIGIQGYTGPGYTGVGTSEFGAE